MMIKDVDAELADAIEHERARQETHLELIASENFVSPAVLEAQGSILTNKYAEGYPGQRYYAGCNYVDIAEDLARERAKEIFGAQYANVQPHSGAQANMAVYYAVLDPGDVVLSMDLYHGGHLTHGSHVNFSGANYNFTYYGVDSETEMIDYDNIRRIALRKKPKMIIAGATSYTRTIHFQILADIAREVDAFFLADIAHIAGLVAAGLHPNPVPCADFVTMTTHKTLRGPRGGIILCKAKYAYAIDHAIFPGLQGGPMMHIIAGKAVALKEAMLPEFRDYQLQVLKNAESLAYGLKKQGIRLVSGGTDNHMVLIDLRPLNLTGKYIEKKLDEANITVNKNPVPFDSKNALITSGIRLGTPALTTRGMKEDEMEQIADYLAGIIHNPTDETIIEETRSKVISLCERFPLY